MRPAGSNAEDCVTAQGLVAMRQRILAGETTAAEVVDGFLDAIAGPAGAAARAFTTITGDMAQAAALAVDEARRRGEQIGSCAGLPVAIKDSIDLEGMVSAAGTRALAGRQPANTDAVVVQRLRAAGAAIIGKTTMAALAMSGIGLSEAINDTPVNRSDPSRVPGGSSSGAAASLCHALTLAAIGTDTGGSIRIPAAFNGLVGFKPGSGRIPLHGVVPLSLSQDTVGPLASCVADCALLDAVMAGYPQDGADGVPPPTGLRILIPTNRVLDDLDAEVSEAFSEALARLSAQGAVIVERRVSALDMVGEAAALGGLVGPEASALHGDVAAHPLLDGHVAAQLKRAMNVPAHAYISALMLRQRAQETFDAEFRDFDMLACPTVAIVPPKLAEATAGPDAFDRLNRLVLRNTSTFNVLDLPAITLPCHAQDSLPVGFMAVGRRDRDRALLAAAEHIERSISR